MSFSTAGWYLHKSLMIWCCCASSSADDPKNWRANVYYFVQINWYWPIHSQCLCVYGCVCGERNERTNTAEEWWQGNTLNRWIMCVYRVLVPRSVKIPLTTTTEWDNVRAENGRGTDRENQKERERGRTAGTKRVRLKADTCDKHRKITLFAAHSSVVDVWRMVSLVFVRAAAWLRQRALVVRILLCIPYTYNDEMLLGIRHMCGSVATHRKGD